MPPALVELVDPASTAVVTQELQRGVVGQPSVFPQLAEIARLDAVPNAARVTKGARRVGIPVVHCVAMRRADGLGSSANARLFGAARKAAVQLTPGSDAVAVDEAVYADDDLVLSRLHGIGPMWGTDLDPILRNLGVRTVVVVGVSVNVGVTNLVMDAVNAGYHVVLPSDAVAGVPEDYATAVIDNTLSLLATIVTTDDLLEAWEG